MIPYVQIPPITLGPFSFHAFEILVSIGFLLGAYLASVRAKQSGLKSIIIYDLALLSLVFGFIAAHGVALMLYHPKFLLENPGAMWNITSGISSYGGFLGACVAIAVYLRRKNLRFLAYGDAFMFGFWPAWTLGRIGCFTAHDHPGYRSDFWLAVAYPGGARHDLGLYEAFLAFGLTCLTYGMRKKSEKKPEGWILASTFLIYGIFRFLLDMLRATDVANSDVRYAGLTPAHYFSLVTIVLAAMTLFRIRKFAATRHEGA